MLLLLVGLFCLDGILFVSVGLVLASSVRCCCWVRLLFDFTLVVV